MATKSAPLPILQWRSYLVDIGTRFLPMAFLTHRLRLPDITQIERYYRTSLSGRRLSAHIDVRNGQLQLALDRALQWVRPQVLAGADVGTVNTNTI